jgi:membrane protease YdiL (CAAX protease family)
MRSRSWRWWRPVLGLLLIGAVWLVAAVVVVLAAVVSGVTPDLELLDLVDPAVLLVTNLSLIAALPAVWLAWAAAHGMGIGWSSSVLARFRWRLVPRLTLIALVTLAAGIGLSIVVGLGTDDGGELTGPVDSFGWLMVVVLLTTPLQSAAEEYVFRGYLSQAIAGWVRSDLGGAILAAMVTATLFSAAHAPEDLATFLDRFWFGLAASAVVWLTGGLEAAVVLHAVNNVLVFTLAGLLGDGVATEEVPVALTPLYLLVTGLTMSAYVALVARSRRSQRPETLTPALDLRGPAPALPVPAR